jgi:hypothetical protein
MLIGTWRIMGTNSWILGINSCNWYSAKIRRALMTIKHISLPDVDKSLLIFIHAAGYRILQAPMNGTYHFGLNELLLFGLLSTCLSNATPLPAVLVRRLLAKHPPCVLDPHFIRDACSR